MDNKTYEFSNLSSFPELEGQANSLIEEVFAYTKNNSFEIDFAPLTSERNRNHRFILIDSTTMQVVAHIGCRLRNFIWQAETYPVCMLGGVAVHPSFQGQGLFSSLMQKIIQTMESQCAFFLLWSDKHEMYEKWEFYLAGKQWCYRSAHESNYHFQKALLKDISPEIKKRIHANYRQFINTRFFSPLRDEEDWKELENITSSDLYFDEQGYHFKNKGMDLTNVIHEIASPENVSALMDKIGNKGTLWYPLNEQVNDDIMMDLQLVGLWKINRHPMALAKLTHLLGYSIEVQDHQFIVTKNSQKYLLHPHELLEELFGYGNYSLRKQSIPIFISGLDSI
jgi:predicted N-acetyltransferase YhbS